MQEVRLGEPLERPQVQGADGVDEPDQGVTGFSGDLGEEPLVSDITGSETGTQVLRDLSQSGRVPAGDVEIVAHGTQPAGGGRADAAEPP